MKLCNLAIYPSPRNTLNCTYMCSIQATLSGCKPSQVRSSPLSFLTFLLPVHWRHDFLTLKSGGWGGGGCLCLYIETDVQRAKRKEEATASLSYRWNLLQDVYIIFSCLPTTRQKSRRKGSIYVYKYLLLIPVAEAEFLDVIGIKVKRDFLLGIHKSPLLTDFTPPPPEQKCFETSF